VAKFQRSFIANLLTVNIDENYEAIKLGTVTNFFESPGGVRTDVCYCTFRHITTSDELKQNSRDHNTSMLSLKPESAEGHLTTAWSKNKALEAGENQSSFKPISRPREPDTIMYR